MKKITGSPSTGARFIPRRNVVVTVPARSEKAFLEAPHPSDAPYPYIVDDGTPR